MTTVINGCDSSDDQPSPDDQFLRELSGTWTLNAGQVTIDGLDVTEAFAGMSITFSTDKSYSTLHGIAPIWPANGSFVINKEADGSYSLLRDNEVYVKVSNLTSTSVRLTMQYSASAGRTKGTSGQYEFTMHR